MVADGDAPGLLWRIFEYCADSLLQIVRHLLGQAAHERVLVVRPESLSHYLQSARVLLDHILPAAESWFQEPGGVGPLPGHGLRSREALRLQLLKVKELEVLLGAIQTEVVFEGMPFKSSLC